jgi:hypothetical protein
VNGNRVEHGRNAEDLLVIEALIARDNALADLPAGDGDSRNRWVLRLIAMPPIPGVSLPGNMRPTFGVETSRAIGGGEQIIRFIYGANVGFK